MKCKMMTDRLVIRDMEIEDAEAIQAFLTPDYYKFQGTDPNSSEDMETRIRRYHELRGTGEDQRMFRFVIIEKQSGSVIGQAGLTRLQFPRIASLGFGLAAESHHQGYGTEAVLRIIAFGFEDLRLHRIEADVSTEHKACLRVMEKAGMTLEGTHRDCLWTDNRWVSETKWSMLAHEYDRSSCS